MARLIPPVLTELVELRDALDRQCRAVAAIERTATVPERPPSRALRTPLLSPATVATDHRRQRRPGRPSRFDTDHELRAFVLARWHAMIFDALVDAIAADFHPDRRVTASTLHRWWHRHATPDPGP